MWNPPRSTPGPAYSEGSRLLRESLVARRWTQTRARHELKLSEGNRSMISRWLLGDRKPGRGFAALLKRKFKIPLPAWDQEAKAPYQPLPASFDEPAEAVA